jgi:hypothetical protein
VRVSDDQIQHRGPLDRPDHDALDCDSPRERDRDRQRERRPVRKAVMHERPRDERGEHRHLALGEVDDASGAVDEDERKRQQRPRSSGGEADDRLLRELRPVEGQRHQVVPR